MAKKTSLGLIIFSIIISLLVGFSVGNLYQQRNIWQTKLLQTNQELNLVKSQYEDLKKQIEGTFPPLPNEVHNTSGKVLKVGNKYLEIEASIQVGRFPLPEGKNFETKIIKVNVDNTTEIFWLGTDLMFPSKPKKVLLTFKDITPGAQVYIVTEEDIKTNQEVTATQIQIL
jgi:hypothetical protein